MIRVLLVDDDPLVRSGLRMMLAGAASLEVVAEAGDGREVLGAVDRHRPDVVLMDIRMPHVNGIAATRLLAAQPDPPAVLVLTTFDADELVMRALQAGAAGFLLKDTPPAEIVRAIELVHAGDGMLSPAVTRRLISIVAGDSDAGARTERARDRLATLSPRERDVALAIGRGQANAQIAGALHLSVATVKAHVSRLLDKLEVDNRVQIALLVQVASGNQKASPAARAARSWLRAATPPPAIRTWRGFARVKVFLTSRRPAARSRSSSPGASSRTARSAAGAARPVRARCWSSGAVRPRPAPGFAIESAFASTQAAIGVFVITAIAIQNVPEAPPPRPPCGPPATGAHSRSGARS
jgi:DNA-binding NarL/FixJ family response regulator